MGDCTPEVPTAVHYCQSAKLLFTGFGSGRLIVWDTSVFPITRLSVFSCATISDISVIDYNQNMGIISIGSQSGLALWLVEHSADDSSGRMLCQFAPWQMWGAPT